ncbi:MAG: signal recognition particle protein [Rickettsia sp.]|nr:signal recognition particle protein [Rickettsia sp.]
MFNFLNQEFTNLLDRFRSYGKIREEHIEKFSSELKEALLNSDTNLEVVENLVCLIQKKAKEQNIAKSLSPSEVMRKIVYEEMVNLLSLQNADNNIKTPHKICNNLLMLGLQGSGKTTASSKIALKLKKQGKKILLVSLDTYRPAAQEQLKILSDSINVDSLKIIPGQSPLEIAKRSLEFAKKNSYEIVIYDTAGRMHIDTKMMEESKNLKKILCPTETILVIDSMMGQESTNIAKIFNDQISIDSFLISRIDGDSKAGAAFSVNYVTKKPIKLLSTGENLENLEDFNPKNIVSRILNMGNLEELINKIKTIDSSNQNHAQSRIDKIKSGNFNFNDYLSEIENINKIGGITKILTMLPSLGPLKNIAANKEKLNTQDLVLYKSIILSMTIKERLNPHILNFSRKKRIANGAGVSTSQVEKLIKKFNKMKILMKKMSKIAPES